MFNGVKAKVIIALLVCAVALVVVCIGVTKTGTTKREYVFKDGDGEVVMVSEDYKYYIGEEQLVRVKRPTFQVVRDALDRLVPGLPYLVVGVLLVLFLRRYVKGLPPIYTIKQHFGMREKELARLSMMEAPGGLICIRGWDVDKQGYLRSTYVRTRWQVEVMESDDDPEVEGWKGIYAYRLGSHGYVQGKVKGVVVLSGRMVGHRDHVVRGAKCQIMMLITSSEKIAQRLRSRYECPVVVTGSIETTLTNWLMSNQGTFWLRHNEKLITMKKREKFEQDVESIPAYEEFTGGGT